MLNLDPGRAGQLKSRVPGGIAFSLDGKIGKRQNAAAGCGSWHWPDGPWLAGAGLAGQARLNYRFWRAGGLGEQLW